MPTYDIVTVVFDEEIELLALQAKSIEMFGRQLSIGNIFIAINGPNENRTIRRVKSDVLDRYGDRRDQVQIVPGRELLEFPNSLGWHSKQTLKLAIAARVRSENCLTLDAKNHWVRPIDDEAFFDRGGVAYFHPHSMRDHDMAEHYYKCAELCGIDAEKSIDRCFPSITPAMLHRSYVLGLHEFIKNRHQTSFERM